MDLSGAFRFKSEETFTTWYKLPAPHEPYLAQAVYGLPELYTSAASQETLSEARLIANPGCYSTSVILALRPLSQAGWIAAGSIRGVPIANLALAAPARNRARSAFRRSRRKFQSLQSFFASPHSGNSGAHRPAARIAIDFLYTLLAYCPRHSYPRFMSHSAKSARSKKSKTLFRKSYARGPWFASGRRSSAGIAARRPHELLRFGFALDKTGRRLIIVSCLDNLGKGAAGQAVQNWNHMLGIEEQTALQ